MFEGEFSCVYNTQVIIFFLLYNNTYFYYYNTIIYNNTQVFGFLVNERYDSEQNIRCRSVSKGSLEEFCALSTDDRSIV